MRANISNERNPHRMINVRELATILDISTRSVWRLAARGELPQPIRFGRNVRWRFGDIESWIDSQITSNNSNGDHVRRIH
jgi:predicted DNA-binding transcriptional regulator AlpA